MINNTDDNIVIYDQFLSNKLVESDYPFVDTLVKQSMPTKIFLSIDVFRNPNISILEQTGLPSKCQRFGDNDCWYDCHKYFITTDTRLELFEFYTTVYRKLFRLSKFEMVCSSSITFLDQLFQKKINTIQYFIENHFVDKEYSKYKTPYYAFSIYDFRQIDLKKYFDNKRSSAENSLQKIIKTHQPRGFESVNK